MAARSINNLHKDDQYHHAAKLKKDILNLEKTLQARKKELHLLRENCNHDFTVHGLVRTCKVCLLKESIYY